MINRTISLQHPHLRSTIGRATVIAGLALTISFTTSSTFAQTMRFKQPQVRVTVPLNSSLSTTITNQVTLTGVSNAVNLDITGLPTGATYTLSTNAITNSNPLTITLNTTNVAQGVYTLSLNGSGGATNHLLFILQSSFVWNGSTNAAVDGAGTWSDASKWLGGAAPGVSDDVIFGDLGGQTNSLVVVPSVSTNFLVSSIVDVDTTVASLRFAETNSATRYHTIQIASGKTLSITGSNGFSLLRDLVADSGYGNLTTPFTVTMLGSGKLVVSNTAANFALLNDGSGNNALSLLDMSGLDSFSATVSRMGLGDYTLWPNYFNLSVENQYNGIPRRFLPNVNLARTNVIKGLFADPFNYTNADNRRFSLSFLNTEQGGTSTQPAVNLGISNMFLLDSVNFVGGNQQGNVRFLSAFASNSPVAIFRGTNGGRMTLFSVSDAGGTNGANSNIKSVIDFASSTGRLDLLTERLYIGRDRKLINGGQNPNYQGFMFMGQGTLDANTVVLGFQEQSGQTNAATFNGYCEGVLVVTNAGIGTSTLRISNSLTLGSCTQTNPLGLGSGGNTTYGKLALGGSNTTAYINTILVGDPIHTSANNLVNVTNGANLVLSNTIGSVTQSLDTLTYANGFLTLHLDLNRTNSYVYATNLATTGSNVIRIATIRNLGGLSGSVPLIQFSAGNGSFQGLIMPPGLSGALLTTNNVGIYLTILTNVPKHLVWRGYNGSDWNLTSPNWLDTATGLHTNFSNGDFVSFDDDPSTPTTIHLAGPIDIIPGGVTMTNNASTYIIDGASGGDIQGSASVAKWGSAGLQIDGPTTLAIQLNQGTLTGSGAIGSATVAAGTTMMFSGSIGSGVACAGTASLSGNSSGTLTVLGTGIVTNTSFGTYSGPFITSEGAFLVNKGTWLNGGNSIVVSNATMINSGAFHALTLTVNGTLEDLGSPGVIYMYGDTLNGTRGLTIARGGNFIVGGDGLGTTTVYPEVGSPNLFPGRVLFAAGSTNFFKVDAGTLSSTLLGSAVMGFGDNQSLPKSFNGGTIVVNNIGAAYAAGQSFTMFQYYQGGVLGDAGLNTTNSYPIMVPATPGPGLAWDLSNLIPNGVISIRNVANTPTNFSFSPSAAVNTGTNGIGTNVIVSELSWPTNYIGWKLQQQVNPLSIGLSTNWTTIFDATFTNYIILTNTLTTNCVFYRMVFP